MAKVSYKSSGVNIDAANKFVDAIGAMTKGKMKKGVIQRKGSFGALFGLDTKFKKPILVSSTDGVGTKLLIAQHIGKHDTVGIDLVAMNVNDVLCTGAKPLFFLDYIACGKVDNRVLQSVMKGIVKGCDLAGCSLIGGETAEMPGMYDPNEYDLAGFTVGVVEESKLIDGSKIKEGDVVIGLASSGVHSNGYSMVRKVFKPSEYKKYAAMLLAPTKIYVPEVLALLEKFDVKGMAHITGGAFYEKLTKILPKGLCFYIAKDAWPRPEIFDMIQERGQVDDKEMFRTFNMGIGFAIVVDFKDYQKVQKFLHSKKVPAYIIGEVIKDSKQKVILDEACGDSNCGCC